MAIKKYVASADTTITNAFKEDLNTRATGANGGAAAVQCEERSFHCAARDPLLLVCSSCGSNDEAHAALLLHRVA